MGTVQRIHYFLDFQHHTCYPLHKGRSPTKGTNTGRAGIGQVPPIESAEFIVTTTDQGRLHSPQIDVQSRSPGLPSLRESITTTYGAAVWLAQLPGFPSARPTEDEVDHRPVEETESGDDSDEVIKLTLPNERDSDEEEDISGDEQGNPDMPPKGWTRLKTTRLNNGSHRVIRLVIGSPSATSGDTSPNWRGTHPC